MKMNKTKTFLWKMKKKMKKLKSPKRNQNKNQNQNQNQKSKKMNNYDFIALCSFDFFLLVRIFKIVITKIVAKDPVVAVKTRT